MLRCRSLALLFVFFLHLPPFLASSCLLVSFLSCTHRDPLLPLGQCLLGRSKVDPFFVLLHCFLSCVGYARSLFDYGSHRSDGRSYSVCRKTAKASCTLLRCRFCIRTIFACIVSCRCRNIPSILADTCSRSGGLVHGSICSPRIPVCSFHMPISWTFFQ